MQKTPKYLVGLVSLSLCFFLLSCGTTITNSSSAPVLTPEPEPISRVEIVEAEEIILDLEGFHNLLVETSEGRFVLKIANLHNEELLITYLRGSDFDLDEMILWADKVIAATKRLSAPIVNEKIREVKALRDAETDTELRARYNAIILRMESNQRTVKVDVQPLERAVNSALVNLVSVEDWIEDRTGRQLVFSDALETAYLAEASLQKLDLELERMAE